MNLLSEILLFFVAALLIAITAFVYSYILVQPGEIFSGLYRRMDTLFNTDKRASEGLGPHPLFRMLIRCEKCVAGQMSLWIFLVFAFPFYRSGAIWMIIPHVLFIGLAIFLALIVKSTYRKKVE